MLRRTIPSLRHVQTQPLPASSRILVNQSRWASSSTNPEITDPEMNGGYVNPPPMKRALRDPYGDWWDKQERRNFGEPVHEDNDTLAVFSTEPYTHASPGRAIAHIGAFVAVLLGGVGIVYRFYPDTPTVPRQFPNGLKEELGGPEAGIPVAAESDEQ